MLVTASMTDREQFDTAALPHLESVYRAAVALCGRRQDADELVQRTFLKAIERFDSFAPGTNCKAWLLRILRNTWFDELRHRRVVGPTVSADDARLAEPDRSGETTWTDARDLLENFSDEQVIKALNELPDDQRLTLYLVDVEELSHEEAAGVLDVAVGTVKSRTSRARAALKERLEAHARDRGFIGRER